MSHWNWQTSLIMALTVAPRDISWQSVNVTLATKRILLVSHFKKFSPHFLRHFNKELKKRTWECSQKNTLGLTLLPLGPRRWQWLTASLQSLGQCLGRQRTFTRETSISMCFQAHRQCSLECHHLSIGSRYSFLGSQDDSPNLYFWFSLWPWPGHSQHLHPDFLNQVPHLSQTTLKITQATKWAPFRKQKRQIHSLHTMDALGFRAPPEKTGWIGIRSEG